MIDAYMLDRCFFKRMKVQTKLVAAFIIVGLFHSVFNAFIPLHPDEAYYWLWSRELDLSYYDHPAMIAWMIRFFSFLGESEAAVRFSAVFCMTIAGYALCMTAYRAFINSGCGDNIQSASISAIFAGKAGQDSLRGCGEDIEKSAETALWLAFISYSAVPAVSMGYAIVTPDSPLIMFWCLAMYWGLKAVLNDGNRYYVYTGAAIAFMIVSKYTAVLFPFSLLFYIMIFNRRLFKNKYMWIACFIGALGVIPIMVWNYKHDWISIAFQYRHGSSGTFNVLWGEFIIFLLGIQVLPTPIFAFIIYKASFFHKKYLRQAWWGYLFSLFFIPLVFFIYKGLFKKMELNWPVIAFFPGFVLMSVYVAQGYCKKLFKYGFYLAASLTLLLHASYFLPLPDSINISLRISGFKESVKALEKYRTYSDNEFFFSDHLARAAIMTYYLKGHPRVYIPVETRYSQYDIWDEGIDFSCMQGLYMGSDEAGPLKNIFKNVQALEVVKAKPRQFYIYRVGY